MQRNSARLLTIALLFTLAACGGGGGGSTTAPATPTPQPSVSGDMLALKASQGWNYQTSYNNSPTTITLYADAPVSGVTSLVGAAVTGLVTTVATSATNMQTNEIGALGFKIDASTNYTVYSEASINSVGTVPGTPLLVPSSLTLGQTWTPTTGASATVTSIGPVPGQSACPNASASTIGAEVQYTYPNYKEVISYVPGCGMTDLKNPTNGAEFTLVSTASYPTIGALGRRVASATYLDTAASLLGQRRNNFQAAKLLAPFFK